MTTRRPTPWENLQDAVEPVAHPDDGPGWEYKQSHCHRIGGRKVWFGLERTRGIERLVHVAIRYEGADVAD